MCHKSDSRTYVLIPPSYCTPIPYDRALRTNTVPPHLHSPLLLHDTLCPSARANARSRGRRPQRRHLCHPQRCPQRHMRKIAPGDPPRHTPRRSYMAETAPARDPLPLPSPANDYHHCAVNWNLEGATAGTVLCRSCVEEEGGGG